MLRACFVIIVASTIAACTGAPPVARPFETRPVDTPSSAGTIPAGRRISEHALAMIGTPYRYGGNRPETGFDCSGLVYYSHAMSGIMVPRTSQAQFRAARKVALRDVAHGDIMFFRDQQKLSHVGIYVGDGMFVHAPASGRSVSLASIESPYYRRHLVAVGRLSPN